MIEGISIGEFLKFIKNFPVIDVRSPGEYGDGHIPGAYNLPLFSDEERKVVGTAYKQQGREQAIKKGLDFFGPKMSGIVEAAEGIIKNHPGGSNTLMVHCWRGGMRSAGVAWLLDLYGFKVYTLAGGYKSFRTWALRQFEKPYRFNIIGGNTGAGKTEALKELGVARHCVIDLEGIAHHKGSAFGGIGEEKQPAQEMFENSLAIELHVVSNKLNEDDAIWIEDESRRIGLVHLPDALWKNMQQSPVYFLDVPFEERLRYITSEYGKFSREELEGAIKRIQKRLGGLNAKNAIKYLHEDNYKECFRILLQYYDKCYAKGIREREALHIPVFIVPCEGVDGVEHSKRLCHS